MIWEDYSADWDGSYIKLRHADGTEHRQSLSGGLNYLGAQGWELAVALPSLVSANTLIFKREKS